MLFSPLRYGHSPTSAAKRFPDSSAFGMNPRAPLRSTRPPNSAASRLRILRPRKPGPLLLDRRCNRRDGGALQGGCIPRDSYGDLPVCALREPLRCWRGNRAHCPIRRRASHTSMPNLRARATPRGREDRGTACSGGHAMSVAQATAHRDAVGSRVCTESVVAGLALGVIALHVVDDNLVQPEPGTAAADHLVRGAVPLDGPRMVAAGYGRARRV